MNKETNIDKVREQTKWLFDAIPIKGSTPETDRLGVISHPFLPSMTLVANPMKLGYPDKDRIFTEEEKKMDWLDVTKEEELATYRKFIFHEIDRNKLELVYAMVNENYKMLWFKACSPFLSDKDYGEFLIDAWITQENPNNDINVQPQEVIQFFKKAKKRYIMQEAELDFFKAFPSKLTVYRGIGKGMPREGLSWTTSKSKAIWFKDRYKKYGEGELLKAVVKKEDILAYTNSRAEKEVIINVFNVKIEVADE